MRQECFGAAWQQLVPDRAMALRLKLAALFIALAVATVFWRQAVSLAFVNLGWVRLSRAATVDAELRHEEVDEALRAFDAALRLSPRHARALVGRGVALASATEGGEAILAWRRADSGGEQLFFLGQDAARRRLYGDAIVYLLGASVVDEGEIGAAADVLAKKACQRTLVAEDTLGPVSREYCSTWLDGNGGSLLIDGQFEGRANAWSVQVLGEPASLVRLPGQGRPPPCALLRGTDTSAAILQVLSLPGGATVRFSGWFRTQANTGPGVSVLVLESVGTPARTRVGARVQGETPWSHYSLDYDVPGIGSVDVRAYAAIVRDGAQVWIDALTLEYVDKES